MCSSINCLSFFKLLLSFIRLDSILSHPFYLFNVFISTRLLHQFFYFISQEWYSTFQSQIFFLPNFLFHFHVGFHYAAILSDHHLAHQPEGLTEARRHLIRISLLSLPLYLYYSNSGNGRGKRKRKRKRNKEFHSENESITIYHSNQNSSKIHKIMLSLRINNDKIALSEIQSLTEGRGNYDQG